MPKSPIPLLKKFKLRKYSNMVAGGALATIFLMAPLAYAWTLDYATFASVTAVQEGINKGYDAAQQALAKAIDKAQQDLQKQLYEKANALAGDLQNKVTSAVTDKLGAITNGPVGKLLGNAGLSVGSVTGANVPGHVDPAITNRQLAEAAAAKNPVDAITAQTKAMLENQLYDRLNVTSMLDEKPTVGTCVSGGAQCTVLTRLREMDAVALNALQATNVTAIGEYVLQGNKFNTNIIRNFYEIAGTTQQNSGPAHSMALFKALTPAPSIPLGYERAPEAADLNKSRWLSHVLIGQKNDVNLLLGAIQLGDETQQVDALSKVAKMQIARSAIMNVHNQEQHNSLNAQFRACVVRPDAQDRVGATQEQQLVHIQSLLRCSNMIQLQSRQQEMESQRLLGTMLLTLLDLYATQNQSVQKR